MGRKHRERRKRLKRVVREIPEGWREDELGQLKKKVSKAEARERLFRSWTAHVHLLQAEEEILNALAEQVKRDIDKEVLGKIWAAVEPSSMEALSP